MKICPVCKSAVPDDAEYCDTCGNDEFFDGYSQQFEQPYQDGYDQQYQNGYSQPQYDYNQNQYQQPQPQYNYNQNQYQQPQPQYNYNQNQYQQPQPQYDYNQNQYQQPQPPQYPEEQQYQQPQYEQPPVEEQPVAVEEPVVEEQPAVIEEPVVEEQPAAAEEPVVEEQLAEEEQPAEEEVPEEPKENPYEVSKNFVFEKSEKKEEAEPVQAEKPKNIKGFLAMFMNTKDHTIEFDKEDVAKNRKNAIIASLGITFWVPFVMKDYSRYARFYGNQGLLTLILMIPCTILYSLITGVVICNACTASVYSNGVEAFKYLTFGGWIAAIVFFAICYSIPIFIIYLSIQNIKQGKAKDIPFIGALRLIS